MFAGPLRDGLTQPVADTAGPTLLLILLGKACRGTQVVPAWYKRFSWNSSPGGG